MTCDIGCAAFDRCRSPIFCMTLLGLMFTGCAERSDKSETDVAAANVAEVEEERASEKTPHVEHREQAESNDHVAIADEGEQLKREELEAKLAGFKVPPDWLSSVTTEWDVQGIPWKDARLEIRRLLGLNDEVARREGIKLTWDYLQKEDIGDRHEYGMYMFLGNEPLWAIIAFRERIDDEDLNYPPYFDIKALASLYTDYGLYSEAEKLLQRGVTLHPPEAGWVEMREAEMHDALGDLYVAWSKPEKATESYGEAKRLYPLSKPPFGRHLLPRRAKKIQSKLDAISMASLDGVTLKDGVYRETALGYSGDIKLTLTVADGKIADIGVEHQEKIDQNACKVIPLRIIEQQGLRVDGISGATVTKDAIVAGSLRALKQAGLK